MPCPFGFTGDIPHADGEEGGQEEEQEEVIDEAAPVFCFGAEDPGQEKKSIRRKDKRAKEPKAKVCWKLDRYLCLQGRKRKFPSSCLSGQRALLFAYIYYHNLVHWWVVAGLEAQTCSRARAQQTHGTFVSSQVNAHRILAHVHANRVKGTHLQREPTCVFSYVYHTNATCRRRALTLTLTQSPGFTKIKSRERRTSRPGRQT
jgi:hypothetical protein